MIFTALEKALLVFVTVLLLTVAALSFLWRKAEGQTRTAALHADSLTAAIDTSHRVSLSTKDSIRILGDSLQVVGRRVFQVPQKNDAIDRAQQLDRVAIANLTAQVRELTAVVNSRQPVFTDSATGDRRATFTIDSTPYHDTLNVSLPPAGAGSIVARLHLAPAAIGLRLGCGPARDGIRSASATMTGPTWLSLELGRVEQSADVCNPVSPKQNLFRRLFSSCGVGPSYGFVLIDGKVRQGPGAVASCRAWP